MFLMYEKGRGMFKIMEILENIGFGGSPPPRQGAFDPISELTVLCSYLFYPNLFPSQVNLISTKKQPECPLLHSASAVSSFLYSARTTGQPKRTMFGFGLQRSFGRNILELLVYYLMPNKCKNLKDTKSSCLSICTSSL